MKTDTISYIVQKLLFAPISFGANKLCILSTNAVPSMASWLLKTYEEKKIKDVSIELIITSTPEKSISRNNHEGFVSLHKSYRSGMANTFLCSYLYKPYSANENLYIWLNEDKVMQAFTCSYDFTQASFLRSQIGTFSEHNIDDASVILQTSSGNSVYCDYAEIDEYVCIGGYNSPKAYDIKPNDSNCVSLPLTVKRTGEPGKKSGLNWGQRKKRNPNEAYIPLPRKIAKSGFFPLEKQHFLVVTDDHHTLLLRVEQQNDKAITTPASNAQLGEYFRNRLELPNGAYIHTSDLDAYGRRDVTFCKIDEDQYYMDFSVKGK